MEIIRIRIIGEDSIVIDLFEKEFKGCDSIEISRGADTDLIVADFGSGREPNTAVIPSDEVSIEYPVLGLVSGFQAAEKVLFHGGTFNLSGLLLRTADISTLEAGILAAVRGLFVMDPSFAGELYRGREENREINLTPREQEVLELIARGLANKTIADELSISEHTVKFHVNSLMVKLDAQSRTEAVVSAMRQGLLHL